MPKACGDDVSLRIDKIGITGDQRQCAVFRLAHDFDLGWLDDLISRNGIGIGIFLCQEHDLISGDQPVAAQMVCMYSAFFALSLGICVSSLTKRFYCIIHGEKCKIKQYPGKDAAYSASDTAGLNA